MYFILQKEIIETFWPTQYFDYVRKPLVLGKHLGVKCHDVCSIFSNSPFNVYLYREKEKASKTRSQYVFFVLLLQPVAGLSVFEIKCCRIWDFPML